MTAHSSSAAAMTVAAGVLQDTAGRVLLSRRKPDQHMAGWWEFPGGKVGAHETALQALVRELHEELDIRVRYVRWLTMLVHDYPERSVQLKFWRVLRWDGAARAAESQPLQWVEPEQLGSVELLPADAPVIRALTAATANRDAQNLSQVLCAEQKLSRSSA